MPSALEEAEALEAPTGAKIGGPARSALEEAEALPVSDIGQGETAARHFGQGLTSNFLDEIRGFFRALNAQDPRARTESAERGRTLFGSTYRGFRDQWRERDREGAVAFPKTAIASNAAGGLAQTAIPVVGGITKIPGVGGAIGGLGASEADLTQGDWAGAAKDVGKGAAIDLATAGLFKAGGAAIQRVARGAPARQEARALGEMVKGVPAGTQDEVFAQIGGKANVPAVLERHGLKNLVGNVPKLDEAIDARRAELGKTLGDWYKAADQAAPKGIALDSVEKALEQVKAKAKARGDHRAVAAVDAEVAGLKRLYEGEGAMSAQQLHGKVQEFGERGFGTSYLDPTSASKLRRDMNSSTRELLQQHVDDVAKAHPGIGDKKALQAANKAFSELSAVGELVEAKAVRLQRGNPTLAQTLQQNLQRGTDAGGALAAFQGIVGGEPTLAAAGLVGSAAVRAAPYAASAVDAAAVKLAQAARDGGRKAELFRLAAQQGIPRAVAAQIIADEERARDLETAPP